MRNIIKTYQHWVFCRWTEKEQESILKMENHFQEVGIRITAIIVILVIKLLEKKQNTKLTYNITSIPFSFDLSKRGTIPSTFHIGNWSDSTYISRKINGVVTTDRENRFVLQSFCFLINVHSLYWELRGFCYCLDLESWQSFLLCPVEVNDLLNHVV